MKTLRSLLWQRIFLIFLIHFIMGTTLGQGSMQNYSTSHSEMSTVATENKGMLASTEVASRWTPASPALPAEEHQSPSTVKPTESAPTATSGRSLTSMDLTIHETSEEPPVTTPAVSHQKIIEATTSMAAFHSTATAAATQLPQESTWSGKESTPASIFVKHPSGTKSSAGKTTPSTFPDLESHTEGRTSFPSTRAPVPDVTPSTEYRTGQTEEEKGPSRPHQNNHSTVKNAGSHNSSHSIPTVKPPASSFTKSKLEIILPIVFVFLLILVILLLYVRYRHRSGSSSISPWSGPAQLGDAPAFDGDAEQGAETAGEGGTRRSTLLSSFGKHQSRASSIPMEDMKGKGEREEVRQLLKTGAGGGAKLEGPEEANGSLEESPMLFSGEASASKAGGGASI